MSHPHPFPPICADDQLNISFWIHPSCMSSCGSEKTRYILTPSSFSPERQHARDALLHFAFFDLTTYPGKLSRSFHGTLPHCCYYFCSCTVSHCVDIPSVQFSHSVVSSSLWPHGLQHARLPCPSPAPGTACSHVHRVGDAIQPSHPLLSPPPPTFHLSQHQVFSNELVLHIRWPKYWSFSFNISPSNEYSGLISFRMDWLDFLAVQGTLKSLVQHHQKHQFFGTQLSL